MAGRALNEPKRKGKLDERFRDLPKGIQTLIKILALPLGPLFPVLLLLPTLLSLIFIAIRIKLVSHRYFYHARKQGHKVSSWNWSDLHGLSLIHI